MSRRRIIGLAAMASVSLGGGGIVSASVPPTEPTGTAASPEQAAVAAALLVIDDFPAGWTEEADEEPTDEELAYRRSVVECFDGQGDDLLDLGGPIARSADFVGPGDQRVEQTVTLVEPAVAEDFMTRFAAPGVAACFRDAVEAFITESLATSEDPGESLPGDMTIGDVTVGEVLLAPAGDELVGYRVTLALTLSGSTIETFIDIVAIRSSGALTGLTFQSLVEPFPAEDVEQYTSLAAERLPS